MMIVRSIKKQSAPLVAMQAEVVFASRATANHRALGVIPCHEMCHGTVANNPNTHRLMSKTASRFSIRHFCPLVEFFCHAIAVTAVTIMGKGSTQRTTVFWRGLGNSG